MLMLENLLRFQDFSGNETEENNYSRLEDMHVQLISSTHT